MKDAELSLFMTRAVKELYTDRNRQSDRIASWLLNESRVLDMGDDEQRRIKVIKVCETVLKESYE